MPGGNNGHVDEAAIREQAYYLWEQDGRPWGRDHEYWERALSVISGNMGMGAKLKAVAKKAAPKAKDAVAAKPAKAAAKPAKPEVKPMKAAASKALKAASKSEPAKAPKSKARLADAAAPRKRRAKSDI